MTKLANFVCINLHTDADVPTFPRKRNKAHCFVNDFRARQSSTSCIPYKITAQLGL